MTIKPTASPAEPTPEQLAFVRGVGTGFRLAVAAIQHGSLPPSLLALMQAARQDGLSTSVETDETFAAVLAIDALLA